MVDLICLAILVVALAHLTVTRECASQMTRRTRLVTLAAIFAVVILLSGGPKS